MVASYWSTFTMLAAYWSRYDPVELDPEVMCQLARENPQELANYSVSGKQQLENVLNS